MTKSLLKILDASVLPAAVMIAAKFIGIYLVIKFLGVEWWGIETTPDQLISSRPVFFTNDVVKVSTNSDIFLLVIMNSFFSYHLVRATVFHDSHIKPKVVAKLAVNGLLGLVSSSYEIYTKATVWLIFLWVSLITVGINAFTDKTEMWVFVVGIVAAFFLSLVFFRDVLYEVNLAKTKLDS